MIGKILVEFSIFWNCQLQSSYLIHSLRALGLSFLLRCFASSSSGSEGKISSVVYQTRLAHLLKRCFHISLEVLAIRSCTSFITDLGFKQENCAGKKGCSSSLQIRCAVFFMGQHHLMGQIPELDVLSQRNRHKY